MNFFEKRRHRACLAVLIAATSSAGFAQTVGGVWQVLGPGPSQNGQVENIVNREVVGAVNALAAHPSNANILHAGGANGGVWRTLNATADAPSWVRLTDKQRSMSVGALELDPTDASSQTLVAGAGRTSSLGRFGGALTGLLRSTNGGANWSLLGQATLVGRTVQGLAPRGPVIVAATNSGMFRSVDTGVTFTLASGIPAQNISDLASDPIEPTRLYAAANATTRGIYASSDTGATWTKVSSAAVDAVIVADAKVELAVGRNNNIFAAIVGSTGRLAEVAFSSDAGDTWRLLGVPVTTERNGLIIGVHAGGQGNLHLSIAADPNDGDVVYIGGDRQPRFGEGQADDPGFPNSLGARDFSGRLFRGDAALPLATRWASITHSGTANNSSPHADSRDMAFDANGELLESDDGGVYRRTSPTDSSGRWLSVNGSLQTTEYHGIAYDAVADRVIGGAQDTGTTEQISLTSPIFNSISTGDGGVPAVEDRASTTLSTRYSSFQRLQGFRRRTFNAANVVQSDLRPLLTLLNNSPAMTQQFYSPISVNYVDAQRLLIGAGNGVYESFDQGSTITRIGTNVINGFVGRPISYGVVGNPEFLFVGAGTGLFLRTTAAGTFTQVGAIAAAVRDVAVDPDVPSRLFAMDISLLSVSNNSGATFSNITGNLSSFDPGELRSMAFVPSAVDDALVVSTDRGIFVSFDSGGFRAWARLGTELPMVPVFELEYDQIDDILIAGTLGRGIWKLQPAISTTDLFRDGFEN